jgi:heme/copper-type cytochrome/quinol oxidase subunit 3
MLFAAYLFSYLYLWTVAPELWPGGFHQPLPGAGWGLAAAAALAASSGAIALAGRWLGSSRPGRHLREQLAIAAAIALIVVALGLELAGQRSAGLDPRASSYAAIVYAGEGIQGLWVASVAVMGAYTIVRSLARRLTRERRATFDCLRLLWHYTVIQGVTLLALLHLAPRGLA